MQLIKETYVVEKNNTGDVLVLEDEGTDDNGVYGEDV